MEEYLNKVVCGDCLEVMKKLPDKCIDLVLTDPPYGIGMASNPVRQKHQKQQWDEHIPTKEYFDEMMRVSKQQIIWGGNYFIEYLKNSKGFLVWNKLQPENFTLAMCEFAWMSIDKPAKMFTQSVHKEGNKHHPTQKPVNLFKWILNKYTNENDTILDPFLGSGTTVVACKQLNRNFIGIEISPDYCKIAEDRLKNLQQTLI